MRVVDRPVKRPMHCAALPYVGQSNRNVRWVDTGSELPGGFDNHVYLSDAAVRQAMQALGYPSPGEHREVRRERDMLVDQLEQANAQLMKLQRELDAVHVLKRAGYQPERKRGPKTREEQAA